MPGLVQMVRDWRARRRAPEVSAQQENALADLTYEGCRSFVPDLRMAKVVKVYDGDTIHLGYLDHQGRPTRISCRIYGIDTPELRTSDENEKAAAKYAARVVAGICLGKIVEVVPRGMDKYGRLLADIRVPAIEGLESAIDVGAHLLGIGMAVAYDGGTKQQVDWGARMRAV